MTYDPFSAEIEPLSEIDDWEVLTSMLKRSILWDLLGPMKMKTPNEKLKITGASKDVLEAEYKEMMKRKYSLLPLRSELSLMSYIAAESASDALLALDERYKEMTDDDRAQFRLHNVAVGAVITDAVLGHLIQEGLLHFGGHE